MEPVGCGGVGLGVGVEQLATLAGDGVGNPDAGGVALQKNQGDALGGHLVVVGVGLGVFADVAAFHDNGAHAEIDEAAMDLEAVGARFHQE